MEDIILNPTATKDDPMVNHIYRMSTIAGKEVKLQQGIYSKADLRSIADQIEAILNPVQRS